MLHTHKQEQSRTAQHHALKNSLVQVKYNATHTQEKEFLSFRHQGLLIKVEKEIFL